LLYIFTDPPLLAIFIAQLGSETIGPIKCLYL